MVETQEGEPLRGRRGDWRRSAWKMGDDRPSVGRSASQEKCVVPMVVEGAMTGEMFLAYVENCLVPTLRRNDIVVMDDV